MTPADPDDSEIIDEIDVGHLEDRPDRLHRVVIKKNADGELRALPFRESRDGEPPGYIEIDVDLMEADGVCRYVEAVSDYDRRIDFTQVPTWPPDGPTATDPRGPHSL